MLLEAEKKKQQEVVSIYCKTIKFVNSICWWTSINLINSINSINSIEIIPQ